MWLRLCVILVALAVQGSFPAKTSQTLHQRYGQPVSETFLVRPGIVVTASYGVSGNTCELVISPKEPDELIKRWPGSDTIDYKLLKELDDELIPTTARGKFKIGTFVDSFCLPENDCVGSEENWENVVMYTNADKGGKAARYGVIQWHRDECAH
jgi:hypothetical protein